MAPGKAGRISVQVPAESPAPCSQTVGRIMPFMGRKKKHFIYAEMTGRHAVKCLERQFAVPESA